jgi:AcrR family transcriptional regulator
MTVKLRQRPAKPAGRTGNQTAQRVIDAARELLTDEGCNGFSMRNVAARASMRLSNVQYYFPTRDDLIRALFSDADRRYRRAYAELLESAANDRVARFEAVIDFNLSDIADRRTRRFFLQFWALLNSLDPRSDRLLGDFYAIDVQHLTERIAELAPQVAADELRRRATLLAALIEGLMVVRGAHSAAAAEMRRLTAAARSLALQIALGEFQPASALINASQ